MRDGSNPGHNYRTSPLVLHGRLFPVAFVGVLAAQLCDDEQYFLAAELLNRGTVDFK
jgi:hypothetical protein